jgi:5-methylcytosine-specific restriction endonuclease McrA
MMLVTGGGVSCAPGSGRWVMVARTAGRKGRPWRRLRDRVLEVYGPVCWLCHQSINLDLHPNHRRAYTVDHMVSLDRGGEPNSLHNCRPAHRCCNSSKGAKPRAVVTAPIRSRDW